MYLFRPSVSPDARRRTQEEAGSERKSIVLNMATSISPTSFLENSIITKHGMCLVVGSFVNSIQYGQLTINFLLSKSMVSERYQNVTCVCLDKLLPIPLQHNNKSKSSKLNIINALNPSLNVNEVLQLVTDSLSSSVSSTSSPTLTSFSNQLIIVSGISEIILRFGLRIVLDDFILPLQLLLSPQSSSLITNIHASLHSNAEIERMKEFFSVIVLPRPSSLSQSDASSHLKNNISSSSSSPSVIIAEILSIRKSSASGRVSEATELFGYDPVSQCIVPNLMHKKRENDNAKSSQLPVNSIPPITGSSNINSNSNNNITSNSTTEEHNHNHAHSHSHEHQQHRPLLVTFDSNDPEFDDDDDPDADLDL